MIVTRLRVRSAQPVVGPSSHGLYCVAIQCAAIRYTNTNSKCDPLKRSITSLGLRNVLTLRLWRATSKAFALLATQPLRPWCARDTARNTCLPQKSHRTLSGGGGKNVWKACRLRPMVPPRKMRATAMALVSRSPGIQDGHTVQPGANRRIKFASELHRIHTIVPN